MAIKQKTQIADSDKMMRTASRIAHEIIERNGDLGGLVLVGIKTRGVPFAKRIRDDIESFEGVGLPLGELDITLYRDDLTEVSPDPKVKNAKLPFDIACKNVILFDDVIYTGRTARAAIDAVLALGRPKSIQLAVMVDRGHRELPIKPDYVGKNIPTSQSEIVSVRYNEIDGEESIVLCENT